MYTQCVCNVQNHVSCEIFYTDGREKEGLWTGQQVFHTLRKAEKKKKISLL